MAIRWGILPVRDGNDFDRKETLIWIWEFRASARW